MPDPTKRHLKPVMARPRSLNVTSFNDVCKQTTKVVYCSDAGAPNGSPLNRLSSPISEMHNNNNKGSFVFRERTPPFSSDSSINSTANMTYKSSCKVKQDDSCCCSTKCWQCSDEQLSCRKCPQNASQNLSWKRLHMSRAKLKATATTSELLSGFAMIAMVELQINEPTNVPEWLFVMFAVCTTILVAVHIFALMISTYILPNIDAIAKLEVCEMVSESPHERMRWFIELAWAFSTVLGLFLFLVEVAILCWVKFWDYSSTAATAATIIVIPVLVIFILFAVHFYHSLVVYKCNSTLSDIEKLEDMKKQLDQVTKTV